MENNRECNHCSANHPELTVPLLEYGFGYQPTPENICKMKEFEQLLAREHRSWEACGLPSIAVDHLSKTTGYRAVRLPIAQHGESQTIDTKVACNKLFGDLTAAGPGRPVRVDSAEFLASFHERSHCQLLGSADRGE